MVGLHVLLVDDDVRRGVKRGAQSINVADGRHHVRRRVDDPVQQQGVSHAAHRTRGDHPLPLQGHRLGPPRPQRVDHGLHVLLVDDQVVGRHRAFLRAGQRRRVIERDGDRRTGHRRHARVVRDRIGGVARSRHAAVGARGLRRFGLHLLLQVGKLLGLVDHGALLALGEAHAVVVGDDPQVDAVRGVGGRRKEQTREQRRDGNRRTPADRALEIHSQTFCRRGGRRQILRLS